MHLARKDIKIGVLELGYAGLPLAVEFGRKYPTVGFDVERAVRSALRRSLKTTQSFLILNTD